MGEHDDRLETLLRIHTAVGNDPGLQVHFDKGILQDLIEEALKFQDNEEKPKKPKPLTGRRAAIAAQKARKQNAEE